MVEQDDKVERDEFDGPDIALILASIAMLQIGRQRAARATEQSVGATTARP